MDNCTEPGKTILTDEELRFLSDLTPCPEGGNLTEFLCEAAEVVKIVNAAQVYSDDKRVRLLLLMRGFYFLGVLRGGEAYRLTIRGSDEPVKDLSLDQCSVSCTELFAEDLEELTAEELTRVCAAVGF